MFDLTAVAVIFCRAVLGRLCDEPCGGARLTNTFALRMERREHPGRVHRGFVGSSNDGQEARVLR